MRNWKLGLAAGALGLAVAACGGGNDTTADDSGAAQAEATASPDGAESADSVAVNESVSPTGSATGDVAIGAATMPPAAAANTGNTAKANDLTAYIGKFPFDEVGGVKWDDHPMVVAGIRKTVKDAAARRAIESLSGPSAPIGTYQGKVGSWACEQHNCGDHQWAVLVDAASGATDVCYHNAAQSGANSRWFLANGREETRPGNCSVV